MSNQLVVKEDSSITPAGDIKDTYMVASPAVNLDMAGGFSGMAIGAMVAFLTSGFHGAAPGSVDSLVAYSEMISNVSLMAPAIGTLGFAVGRQAERYMGLITAAQKLNPGYSLKKLKFALKVLPSFKEKRITLELDSNFGRPSKEVDVVTKGTKIYLEALTKRDPIEVWDESMKSVRAIYEIAPKPKVLETQSVASKELGFLNIGNNAKISLKNIRINFNSAK